MVTKLIININWKLTFIIFNQWSTYENCDTCKNSTLVIINTEYLIQWLNFQKSRIQFWKLLVNSIKENIKPLELKYQVVRIW